MKQPEKLPESFRPLMWSYKFEDIDPAKHREELIVNTVNFGNLDHWRWLIQYYGKEEIRHVLEHRWETEFNRESLHLIKLIFDVKKFRKLTVKTFSL